MVIPIPDSAFFPPRERNAITPLVDGGIAFDRIASTIESATSSLWVCVAFLEQEATFPEGRGTFFDLLDGAASRGLDVRALIWHPEGPSADAEDTLCADAKSIGILSGRDTLWQARWDAVGMNCQHQKVWIIDAGTPSEIAFVGGINITQGSMTNSGHEEPTFGKRNERYSNIHDVHCQIQGPVTSDVHQNFVMRWNHASEQNKENGSWPKTGTENLSKVDRIAAEVGNVKAQITRSILPDLYSEMPEGENSVRQQYLEAFEAAEEYVYIENQILLSRACLDVIHGRLEKGIPVLALVPADPMSELSAARSHPGIAAAYEALAKCGEYPNFCLAAPAALRTWGYEEIYVHSKTAIIDDAWATIGSTNLVFSSFQGDTEMNVSFWDNQTARAFRTQLFDEHGGFSSAKYDGREAIEELIEIARRNTYKRGNNQPLQGFIYAIEPSDWAK
jgi:cardiolipin synthase A/B